MDTQFITFTPELIAEITDRSPYCSPSGCLLFATLSADNLDSRRHLAVLLSDASDFDKEQVASPLSDVFASSSQLENAMRNGFRVAANPLARRVTEELIELNLAVH